MNQDQVKQNLLLLEEVPDFALIFSGKKSTRVDGLYKPESREIIIHNKNMETDRQIMYTAIHEFAHHVHFVNSLVPISNRAHTNEFWTIFHKLLKKSEEIGVYTNGFDNDPEIKMLTAEIKEKYLKENGKKMLEFGKCLVRAMTLCQQKNLRFEDYLDRVLLLPRDSAMAIVNIAKLEVNPELGYENMKVLAGIKDKDKRKQAEQDLLNGESPVIVKSNLRPAKDPDPLVLLTKEKLRLERTIASIQHKVDIIDGKINSLT